MDTSSRQEARVIIEGRGLAIAIMEAWMKIIGRTMPFIFTKLTRHCKMYPMMESGMRTHCHAPWKSQWVGLIFGDWTLFSRRISPRLKIKTQRVLRASYCVNTCRRIIVIVTACLRQKNNSPTSTVLASCPSDPVFSELLIYRPASLVLRREKRLPDVPYTQRSPFSLATMK